MAKSTILIQLDTDALPSTFDAVVAVDAGAERLFSYGGVTPQNVTPLVHGAMFTRGGDDLARTAIFIGGSDVQTGEALLKAVRDTFFGPVRVSVMLDANGANTTAAAAVLVAAKHVDLNGATAVVLGGTGPVGSRAARLLARSGARVRIGSRNHERAAAVAKSITAAVPNANVEPMLVSENTQLRRSINGATVLIAAGAAGVQLVATDVWRAFQSLKVAIDLNAVPPAGLEGVGALDRAVEHFGVICYGAIGVGGGKMKIHKEAIRRLFTSNALVLDAEAIFEIGRELRPF